VAGHVGLELRNVGANYPFESSRGFPRIIHAGDVGSPDVLARLGALARVHAVRGNVDHGAWSANLPVMQRIEIDGFLPAARSSALGHRCTFSQFERIYPVQEHPVALEQAQRAIQKV
jgi:hypothetical protein